MLIWATQVRNLGWKSPKNNHSHEISNSSCSWQNLKFRGNGSCFKMSVWCWPAPGRRVAQARKTKPMWLHVFMPLKHLGLAQIKKEHLRFLFCGSSFKYHPPDSWSFEHEEETGSECIFNMPHVQTYFELLLTWRGNRIRKSIGGRFTHAILAEGWSGHATY